MKKQERENPLVKLFGPNKQWVNWIVVMRKDKDGNNKPTKAPYHAGRKKYAESTDPKTWQTYEEAVKNNPKNVGIIMTPDKKILAIDIDDCLVKGQLKHPEAKAIKEFVKKANSYTEVSPSGTGFHVLLQLEEPFTLEASRKHGRPYEVYNTGRFFTYTGDVVGKEARAVRPVGKEEAISLLKIIGYPWKVEEEVAPKTIAGAPLEDHAILEKMFGAKNGPEVKALYEGDISKYAKDESAADMALLMHFAFWTNKNPTQMERLWLASPLGRRGKTQQRQKYRTTTIQNAIKTTKDTYEPKVTTSTEINLMFTLNKDGDKIYPQNTENMCRILRNHPEFKGTLRYEEFAQRLQILDKEEWREIRDDDEIGLMNAIAVRFTNFSKVAKAMIHDAVMKVAFENRVNVAKDFLKGLTWDGVPRLDMWLTSTYGAPDDELHHKIASNWWKGMVNRMIEPGCQFDHVLVLEGRQGLLKSSSLAIIGGPWYVETSMGTDTKDFFQQFAGKCVIEFSEGEVLSKTETKRMKAIVTTRFDRYRVPYGKYAEDFPRSSVFAMTTNEAQYLKDETGNRRWLPVAVRTKANVEQLKKDRDQLFAEAYHRLVVLKETTYEFPQKELEELQDARREAHPWEEIIYGWYFSMPNERREKGITLLEAHKEAIHQVKTEVFDFQEKLDVRDQRDLAAIFRNVLRLERRRLRNEDGRQYKFFPTIDTVGAAPVELREEINAIL